MSIPDILEGLSCCSMTERYRDCESCPFKNEMRCMDKMLEQAAEVILKYEVRVDGNS